jgi:hypothetical protein
MIGGMFLLPEVLFNVCAMDAVTAYNIEPIAYSVAVMAFLALL